MRTIDLERWPRRTHFETYRDAHLAHFNLCADVDVGATLRAFEDSDVPVTAAIVYVTARAANDIPEFRCRIRGKTIVEHEMVHPSSTVLADNDLFTFCQFEYSDSFPVFVKEYREAVARVRENPTLEDPPGRDDLLFMTAIPWVSFTSFAHPVLATPIDSIPRIAWGRFRRSGDEWNMPLSVQGHHALIDGLHVGRYFERVQGYFGHPERFSR